MIVLISAEIVGIGLNNGIKEFKIKTSTIQLTTILEDLIIAEETLKNNPNLSIEELVVDYEKTIKIKDELSEEIKNTEKELEESSNSQYLLLKFNILMILICLWSTYMRKTTTTTREDYIELLSEINFLKEFQELVTEKDWLLKKIKEYKDFENLLRRKEFQEYLNLFEKEYINDYFKDEISEIKEKVSIISDENILIEKEDFKIIKM